MRSVGLLLRADRRLALHLALPLRAARHVLTGTAALAVHLRGTAVLVLQALHQQSLAALRADGLRLVMLSGDNAASAEAVGRRYGARSDGGLLDGWLVHTGDTADVPGVEVREVPALMTDVPASARLARHAFALAGFPDV